VAIVVAAAGFVLAALAMRYLRRPLRAHRRGLVRLVAIAAGIGAALADGAPTGWSALDLVLRVALAMLVPLATSEAAYGWVVAGVTVLAVGSYVAADELSTWTAIAVGVAAVLPAVGAANRPIQAVAGAAAVTGILRLDAGPLESVAVGVPAVVLLTVPAVHRLGPRARRVVVASAAAAAVVAVAGAGVGLLAAAAARGDLEEGADLAVDGIDLLGDDDDLGAALLHGAAEHFGAAADALDAWWARPARLVPVVAQHVRAASTMASVGEDLAEAAGEAVEVVDVRSLRIVDGTVDLDAVRSVIGPSKAIADDLDLALTRLDAVDTPWLLEELREPLGDMAARVDDARGGARTVADVAEILPGLLGGDAPRRYLLLVQNPAEARGSGGLPGNFGEIVAVDGHVELVRTGRLEELIEGGKPPTERIIDIDPEARALFVGSDPRGVLWQNTTASPDFADVATLTAQLYPQSGGRPVNGVVSVDPLALDALLELTGPVVLTESAVRLKPGEAAQLFLHDQYRRFDERDERGQRVDLLDEAINAIWDALTQGNLASARKLADTLDEVAAGEHVQFITFDEREREVLAGLGLTGELPEPVSDGVGVVVQNAALNKMDWYLDRNSRYEAVWDPRTGDVAGTLSVRLRNRAPSRGQPDAVIRWGGPVPSVWQTQPGEYAAVVHIYTAMPPVAVRVGGEPVTSDTLRHDGWYVTPVDVRVPSGGRTEIDVDVRGRLEPGRRYGVVAVRQPSINGDHLGVLVEVASNPASVTASGIGRRVGPAHFAAEAGLDEPFSFLLAPR
jgi:hypothetical protein